EQRLHLIFATHEVTLRGNALRRIETAMQRLELSLLSASAVNQQALFSDGQPFIAEIAAIEISPSELSTKPQKL
nr:hypothetical protein [Verrucomicrobiota bacterium]